MGYHCVLLQIRERTLMDIDDEQVPRLVERAREPARRLTSLSVLSAYAEPALAGELPPPVSLGKDYLTLHHLLTGQFHLGASPLSRAVLGGTPIGPNLGAGPARYLWADEVCEIATALSSLTGDDLRRRYDPAGLKGAWPKTPIRADDDDDWVFSGLESYFQVLDAYYRIAKARGHALLIAVI